MRRDASPAIDDDYASGVTRTMSDELEYIYERLNKAVELQQTTEGEIASMPHVVYCLECDTIAVDDGFCPDGCLEHKTVSSDGYEHGGIHDCVKLLSFVLGGDAGDE